MKMYWIFLTIGLTFAAKLDWTYQPPPRLSGKNPGNTNIPFKQPGRKHNNEEFSKAPELNVEINKLGPNQADNIYDEISNYKPTILNNGNSLTTASKITSSGFKQSLPFLKHEEDPIPSLPEVNYNLDHPSNYFDNLQQIYNVEKYPKMSLYEKNRVYLPSYGRDSDNRVFYITLPSPVINEEGVKMKTGEYKNIDNSKDSFSLNLNVQQSNNHSSSLSPGYLNNANSNIAPHTIVSPSQKEHTTFNHIENHRPHRSQVQAEQHAVILNYEQSINPEGYAYSYETSNGIHGEEKGTATNGVKAEGSYSYLGDDGILYKVEYTADQNGFMPKGAHLPTAPPIPDAILKVIEQATRDKESGIYDDGLYDEKKYGYKKYQVEYEYPKVKDNVNGANFPKENEKYFDDSDLFDEYHDSCEQKGVEKIKESQEMEFTDQTNNSENHDNGNDDKINNTSPSKIVVLNKNYQYPDSFSQSDLDLSTLNKNSEILGYDYLPPQKPVFNANKFKPRFSEIDHTRAKENDTEEITPKPFLTSYVTRRGDNSEMNDYDDLAHSDTDSNEQPFGNRFKGNNEDDTITKTINIDKAIDSREFIYEDVLPEQQEQYGDRIHNYSHLPSNEEVYSYKNANNSLITLSPGVSYTTSAPTDFSSIMSTQNVNHTSGRNPSSLQISSITNTTLLIDNSSAREPISPLPKYAISPVLDNESTSVYPDAYDKTDSIKSFQTVQTTILVPRFGMLYRPTNESPQYTEYNIQTSTENTIGVNFSGPKESQRFDHIAGFNY